METITRNRAKKRVLLGALGAGAGSLLCAPAANAQELPTLDNLLDGAIPDAGNITPNTPKPALPTAPVENIAHAIEGAVPSNLLRTNTGNMDAFEQPNVQVTPHADTTPAPMAQNTVDKAINNYNDPAQQIQKIAQPFLDAMNGHNDPNTIGQAFGAWQLPNANTVDHINKDLSTLGDKITSGEIVNDIQSAIDQTIHSPQYEAWRTNTDSILRVDGNLHGVDRAAAGISHLIDTVSTNPARAVMDITNAAGGPVNIILNPINAAVRVATTVLGEDVVRDFTDALKSIPGNLGESLVEALPALLTIPAGTLIGSLLGAPLGALPGAGIGGLLGALAPHNLIPGLLAAIPGSILGGLATGIPGAIAATLIALPLLGVLPLLGAAGASALALAVISTVTFGTWLLTLIPVYLFALGVGTVGAAIVLIGGAIGIGPGVVNIPQAATMALAAIGGAILTFIFFPPVLTGLYALSTIAIPAIAFGILALLFLLPAATLGALAGLATALTIAAIGIPLVTALSALPGAILGGLTAFLAGTALSSWISALIGAGIGALVGGTLGAILGATLGTIAGTAIGVPLFTMIAALTFGDKMGDAFAKPLDELNRAWDQGWRHSKLGQLLGTLEHNFYRNTETGRAWGDLLNRINNLWHTMAFLDGRRLRDMLLRGGLLGSILGAIPGALTGGTIGSLLGLFNPLNLLNGLAAFAISAIPGALIGATLGSLLSDGLGLLTALAVPPLAFLPWLIALSALWAIPAIPIILTAWATTLIPPLALAAAAWIGVSMLVSSPLWIPLTIGATLSTLTGYGLLSIVSWLTSPVGAAIIAAFPPAAAIAPFLFAIGTAGGLILGSAGIWAFFNFITISGALIAGFFLLGIPTFLITAPLFTFPALATTLAVLLTWPVVIPQAIGASILTGIAAGAAVDGLSKLLTIPAGALLGALAKGIPNAVLGTTIAALTRALTYGAAGAGIGGGIGAVLGFIPGVIAALVTHLRANAGSEADGTQWVDGRIVDRGGFGDLLADLPGIGADSPREPSRLAVPNVGMPRIDGSSIGDNYALSDNTALLGV